jgi:hypothetical protein
VNFPFPQIHLVGGDDVLRLLDANKQCGDPTPAIGTTSGLPSSAALTSGLRGVIVLFCFTRPIILAMHRAKGVRP